MSRVPRVIAWTELRRSIRILFASPTKVLTLGLLVIIGLGPFLSGVGLGSFLAGRAIQAGVIAEVGEAWVVTLVRGGVAVVWLLLWSVAVLRAATQTGTLDLPDVLLTGTTVRNVVLGVLYGELVRFGLFAGGLGALIGIPVALGAGQRAFAVAVPGLVVFLLLSAVPAGYPVGIAIRHLMTTYRPVARLRVPLLLALLGGYITLLLTERFEPLVMWLVTLLDQSPLAWPAELLLYLLPGLAAEPWPVVAAVGVTGLLAPCWVALTELMATIHWYRDRGQQGGGLLGSLLTLRPLERLFDGRIDRRVLAVCVTTLRRTRRAPLRVLYVAYPVLGSVFFIAEVVRRGEIPLVLFVLLAGYVVWAAGALFTLNPLGDLGPVVGSVVASPVRGREVMRGYCLAAWIVAMPVAAAVVVAAALVGDLTGRELWLLAGATFVGTAIAPLLGLGVGAMFPRFGAVRLNNRREAVMPSKLAVGVYSSFISIPVTAALVLSSPRLVELLDVVVAELLAVAGEEAVAVSLWVVRLAVVLPGLSSIPLALIAFRLACYQYDQFALS